MLASQYKLGEPFIVFHILLSPKGIVQQVQHLQGSGQTLLSSSYVSSCLYSPKESG